MTVNFRGKDRVPYNQPGSNRKPGMGRQAKYPWRTWMSEPRTWEVDTEDRRGFKAMIAVRVSKANKQLREAGSPGWVAYRAVIGKKDGGAGGGPVLLTFWWVPGTDLEPEDVVPEDVQDLFARRTNMAAEDSAAEQERLQVPAYGPEWQERLVAILCPSQYRQPVNVLSAHTFDHWRGWKAEDCDHCAVEPAPVDLGTDQ